MMKYFAAIEQPARHEQHAGELRPDELLPVAAGAVQDQHRVGHVAPRVALRLAQRGVMQPQLRQGLAGLEVEIAGDEVAFLVRRAAASAGAARHAASIRARPAKRMS